MNTTPVNAVPLDDGDEEPSVTYVGVPANVPTIYVDNCAFVTSVGATVKMQFVEFVPGAADSTSPGMKVRYVMNLVMPVDGFHHMLDYFTTVRDKSAEAAAARDAADGDGDGE